MYKTKPLLGGNSYLNRNHKFNKDLDLFYLFNEGGGIQAKELQRGLNGTLTGFTHNRSSGWNGSLFGSGIKFDGTPNWIPLGQQNVCQGSFSTVAWIKILATSDANGSYIFSNDQSLGTGGSVYTRFAWTQARNLFLKVGSNNSSRTVISTNTLNVDTWYFVACTCSSTGASSTLDLYVNGVKAATTVSGAHTSIVVANRYCSIGALDYIHGSFVLGYVQGYIDHLRHYENRVLTSEEILELYKEPFDDFNTAYKKYYLLPTVTSRSYGFIIG